MQIAQKRFKSVQARRSGRHKNVHERPEKVLKRSQKRLFSQISTSLKRPEKVCRRSTHSTRHRFPNPDKDRKRFDVWLQLVQNPNLLELGPKRIFTNYHLCHQHFTANDKSLNMFLVWTAIPTQNLPPATESTSTSTASASVSTSTLQVTGEELLNPKRNEELPLPVQAGQCK